eukprot:NODE_382_length_8372_cov_0.676538.p5 type:complete len:208 gc:universal NODE_382_length_8372_cov_0.676538:6790-6167(-)
MILTRVLYAVPTGQVRAAGAEPAKTATTAEPLSTRAPESLFNPDAIKTIGMTHPELTLDHLKELKKALFTRKGKKGIYRLELQRHRVGFEKYAHKSIQGLKYSAIIMAISSLGYILGVISNSKHHDDVQFNNQMQDLKENREDQVQVKKGNLRNGPDPNEVQNIDTVDFNNPQELANLDPNIVNQHELPDGDIKDSHSGEHLNGKDN